MATVWGAEAVVGALGGGYCHFKRLDMVSNLFSKKSNYWLMSSLNAASLSKARA